jgi:hypothetical protein
MTPFWRIRSCTTGMAATIILGTTIVALPLMGMVVAMNTMAVRVIELDLLYHMELFRLFLSLTSERVRYFDDGPPTRTRTRDNKSRHTSALTLRVVLENLQCPFSGHPTRPLGETTRIEQLVPASSHLVGQVKRYPLPHRGFLSNIRQINLHSRAHPVPIGPSQQLVPMNGYPEPIPHSSDRAHRRSGTETTQ